MLPITLAAIVLAAPPTAPDVDAKALAQDILTKGAALFDARGAAMMAATYTDDAKLCWIERDRDLGGYKVETKQGRSEIEALYSKLFNDASEKNTTSKNTVEFAKLIAPDLLVIEGEFEPVVGKGTYSFVQERVKKGDKWLIQSLRIFIVPKD